MEILDSPPFYLEKHLNFFRDKYSQYFNLSTFEPNHTHKLVAPHHPRLSSSFTPFNLQRANSLNLTTANHQIISKI